MMQIMSKYPIDDETKIIRKYKMPVIEIIKGLSDRKQMRKVCRENLAGMNPARLTEIHKGDRELTLYYLSKLVQGGIVTIDQILQGRKLSDLPEQDQLVILRLKLKDSTLRLLQQLEDERGDVDENIKFLIGKN